MASRCDAVESLVRLCTILALASGVHEELNALTEKIIGAALEVHHELGPGLLENACDECFAVELASRGLTIERQKTLPVTCKNQRVNLRVSSRFSCRACRGRGSESG
jgi:PD-(D/E)XK nuclease superfamily protein